MTSQTQQNTYFRTLRCGLLKRGYRVPTVRSSENLSVKCLSQTEYCAPNTHLYGVVQTILEFIYQHDSKTGVDKRENNREDAIHSVAEQTKRNRARKSIGTYVRGPFNPRALPANHGDLGNVRIDDAQLLYYFLFAIGECDSIPQRP